MLQFSFMSPSLFEIFHCATGRVMSGGQEILMPVSRMAYKSRVLNPENVRNK
jgi:hypothetical protein